MLEHVLQMYTTKTWQIGKKMKSFKFWLGVCVCVCVRILADVTVFFKKSYSNSRVTVTVAILKNFKLIYSDYTLKIRVENLQMQSAEVMYVN
jgi:hypothetical protein